MDVVWEGVRDMERLVGLVTVSYHEWDLEERKRRDEEAKVRRRLEEERRLEEARAAALLRASETVSGPSEDVEMGGEEVGGIVLPEFAMIDGVRSRVFANVASEYFFCYFRLSSFSDLWLTVFCDLCLERGLTCTGEEGKTCPQCAKARKSCSKFGGGKGARPKTKGKGKEKERVVSGVVLRKKRKSATFVVDSDDGVPGPSSRPRVEVERWGSREEVYAAMSDAFGVLQVAYKWLAEEE
jgi:hypothetical protein